MLSKIRDNPQIGKLYSFFPYPINMFVGNKNTRIILITIGLIAFISGLSFRATYINRSPTYDEVWSFYNWAKSPASQILSSFVSPNNHPLNSLFMKLSSECLGTKLYYLRLHSFISGILIPLITAYIGWLVTRRLIVAIISGVITSFEAGLVYYSHVARGYSMETFFIEIFLVFVLLFQRSSRQADKKKYFVLSSGIFVSFVLASMSLPPAILFLFPIILWYIIGEILEYKREQTLSMDSLIKTVSSLLLPKNVFFIITCFFITLFSIWLYVAHFNEFLIASKAGAGFTIHNIKGVFRFFISIYNRTSPFIWIFIFIGYLVGRKNKSFFILLSLYVLFPLAAAIIIKAGPPRVYLPWYPLFAVAAAIGIYRMTFYMGYYLKKFFPFQWFIVMSTMLFLSLFYFSFSTYYLEWANINWGPIIDSLSEIFPSKNTFFVFDTVETLPISAGFPGFRRKNQTQILKPSMLFAIISKKIQVLQGLDKDGSVYSVKIVSKKKPKILHIKNLVCASVYKILPLRNHETMSNIVILTYGSNVFMTRSILQAITRRKWFSLNGWFNGNRADKNLPVNIYLFSVIEKKINIRVLEKLERNSKGKFRFYILTGIE